MQREVRFNQTVLTEASLCYHEPSEDELSRPDGAAVRQVETLSRKGQDFVD